MLKTVTAIVLLACLSACGDSDSTTSTTTTTTTSSTQWWVTETGLSTTTTTTKSTTTTKDTASADNSWAITLEDGISGSLSLEYDDGSTSCKASGAVTNAVDIKDCADCYFAKTMDIGEVSIDADGGGCDELKIDAWSQSSASFGAGAPDYGEFHGMYYTSLYYPKESGDWVIYSSGYSTTYKNGEAEAWTFGGK